MKKTIKCNLSEGNKKLVKSSGNRFLIWNLPSEITCPFATENCKKLCYAKKSERMYVNVRACRLSNFDQSRRANFVNDMIETIEVYMEKISWIGNKIFFRIHESGDFYNMEYMQKWIEIANHFMVNKQIIFLAYTKSLLYYEKLKKEMPTNLIIRASIWNDTQTQELEITESNKLPYFTALSKQEIDQKVEKEGLYKCVGNCGVCKVCYTNTEKIAVEIH